MGNYTAIIYVGLSIVGAAAIIFCDLSKVANAIYNLKR